MMTDKQKRTLGRIAVSALLLVAAALWAPQADPWRLAAFLVPYMAIGWDILYRAIRNIVRGQVFDENFLMALATVGALCTGEYAEATFVMLFYQVGEWFQGYAVGKSRKSIAQLMDIRPDYANVEADGAIRQVDPETVAVGDTIVVKAGERIPLDGVVLTGSSSIDTAALTGESLPRSVGEGGEVISGCVNLTGLIRVRVTRPYGESTVSKILDLVENASAKKAKAEHFITKFARVYTPAVVGAAALLALVPPLFAGQWGQWLHRALTFLVISCPCALVISVPLSFFGGIGGASKRGVLVKGGNYLESLARAQIVVFDKTGTLTKGEFGVTAVHPDRVSQGQLMEMAAMAESYSDHPISQSIKKAYGKAVDLAQVTEVVEQAGHGVSAKVNGQQVHVGNGKLMDQVGAAWHPCHKPGTAVHVAADGDYAGHIVIADQVKQDAANTITRLKALGVRRTVMLTGDSQQVGEAVAQELGLDEVHAGLLPADKVARVEQLLTQKTGKGTLVFVGDGINDAPVLSRADVGIAMGAMGSDAAIEAADIVLMDDQPIKIATAIQIARKTMSIVRQNIGFALAVKLLVLVLGAMGLVGMWAAVFADVGVSVIAILNAMRALG